MAYINGYIYEDLWKEGFRHGKVVYLKRNWPKY